MSGIFARTNTRELARLVTDLSKLHNVLWHWYRNGVRPRTRPSKRNGRKRDSAENAEVSSISTLNSSPNWKAGLRREGTRVTRRLRMPSPLGRHRLSRRKQIIEEHFDARSDGDCDPRYNTAPTQPVSVIRGALPWHTRDTAFQKIPSRVLGYRTCSRRLVMTSRHEGAEAYADCSSDWRRACGRQSRSISRLATGCGVGFS
jgi:hypothetical protein